MKRFWAMRSAVVTGGQGFMGRHLVNALRQRGVKVTTLGRRPSVDTGHIVVEEESWGTPALDRVFQNVAPDCIFHLAGRARGTPAELTYANLGLLQGLLQSLRRTTLQPQLVIAGSAAEYGSAIRDGEPIRETLTCAPLSPYGASKQAQTRAALAYAERDRNFRARRTDLQRAMPEHANSPGDRRFRQPDRSHAAVTREATRRQYRRVPRHDRRRAHWHASVAAGREP